MTNLYQSFWGETCISMKLYINEDKDISRNLHLIPKTDGDVMAQAVLLTDWVGEADSSLILTARAHTYGKTLPLTPVMYNDHIAHIHAQVQA